jgi:glyoxylase-like metal-dependent hydrolase (beta-lactamase superfamily II)
MYFEKNLVVGAFQCNCKLLACPRTGDAVLVDPGDDAAQILNLVQNAKTSTGMKVRVRYLLQTHGHLDHVGASRPVKQALATHLDPIQIALHKADEPLYLALRQQGQLFGIEYQDPLPVDHYLEDGEELKVGDLHLSVMHTPGHSPGSVCLRLHEDSGLGIRESVFSGDTLFQGSVGRTDLWGADSEQMFKSIRQRILKLDDDTRVCPGHGPETRIGIEKRSNPFLK